MDSPETDITATTDAAHEMLDKTKMRVKDIDHLMDILNGGTADIDETEKRNAFEALQRIKEDVRDRLEKILAMAEETARRCDEQIAGFKREFAVTLVQLLLPATKRIIKKTQEKVNEGKTQATLDFISKLVELLGIQRSTFKNKTRMGKFIEEQCKTNEKPLIRLDDILNWLNRDVMMTIEKFEKRLIPFLRDHKKIGEEDLAELTRLYFVRKEMK